MTRESSLNGKRMIKNKTLAYEEKRKNKIRKILRNTIDYLSPDRLLKSLKSLLNYSW